MYEVQLNAYAYIGNRCNFNPVSGIGLVYYEPQTDLTLDNLDERLLESGFYMEFTGKLHKVVLDPDRIIPPLLKQVRKIVDSNTMPPVSESCKDCMLLDKLAQTMTS